MNFRQGKCNRSDRHFFQGTHGARVQEESKYFQKEDFYVQQGNSRERRGNFCALSSYANFHIHS